MYSTVFSQGWQYLGQTPPGNTPALFPPAGFLANTDWFWHGLPAFSTDGEEMYFTKYQTAINKHSIWFSKLEGGTWSAPALAAFSTTRNSDNNPRFFGGDDTMYFHSARPTPNIYAVNRVHGQWSIPVSLNLPIPAGQTMGLQFSIAENGNIYSELEDRLGNSEIYRWKKNAGGWDSPTPVSAVNSSDFDGFPTIDPKERFLLFSSNRKPEADGFDIFISYRTADDSWTAPVNLSKGAIIPKATGWTVFSSDGNYLFFTRHDASGFNPYWIKARFLYK